ncbi:MAG TPA: hypothetical protein VFL31_05985, partial [Nitrospiraceae bacterium]|nr:hypothetical protein [Nitrospiraceae bacterium]
MTMRLIKRTSVCLACGLVGLVLMMVEPTLADPKLRKLECVAIQAAVMESGSSLGITTDSLHEALLAGVKAKLPRLKVDPSCSNRIFFKVFMQNIAIGTFDGF